MVLLCLQLYGGPVYDHRDPQIHTQHCDDRYSDSSFSLTESTTMNIPLEAYRVSVHVQDPDSQPVSNVGITTNYGWNHLKIH